MVPTPRRGAGNLAGHRERHYLVRMDPTTSPSIGTGLLAVVLLVLANAYFVAAEFALVGARRTRLDEMALAGDRKAVLARRAVRSLDRYISATQLGITLASLGLGWIGKPALAGLLDGLFAFLPETAAVWTTHAVSAATAFAIITALHIVLGELVPKSLALLYPEDVSRWVAGPLIGFSWLMAGPISLLNGTANWLLGLVKIKPRGDHERLHSTEEIRMLVEQSQERRLDGDPGRPAARGGLRVQREDRRGSDDAAHPDRCTRRRPPGRPRPPTSSPRPGAPATRCT